MTDLEFKMGELVGRIDALIERMDRDADTAERLEVRVRSLEESRSKFLGLAAGVGAIVGWLISLLTK